MPPRKKTDEEDTVPHAPVGDATVPLPDRVESPVVRQPVQRDVEEIQLINVSLKSQTYTHPKGEGVAAVRVLPFEATAPMSKSWAEKVIGEGGTYDRGRPREMPYYHWRRFAVLPPEGRKMVAFKEPNGEREYNINGYREKDRQRPDGKPMLHSEVQAFNFLRVCPTKEMIQLFLDQVDDRPNVRLYAQEIVGRREREDAERKNMPVATRRRRLPT